MRKLGKPEKAEFGFEPSKGYMATIIALFHIVPLVAVMGNVALSMMPVLCMIVNPMVIFIVCVVFGVKQGFTWKMPLFVAVVFAPSVFMYYMDMQTPEDMMYAIQTTLIFMIVYFIFSLIATAVGGLFKKWL